MEFYQSRKLTISNTIFKKEEKKITYKSVEAEPQIDCILQVRRNGGMKILNCKVIPGEARLPQHRLVCSDLRIEGMKRNGRKKGEKKIKQWKLERKK